MALNNKNLGNVTAAVNGSGCVILQDAWLSAVGSL